VDHKKAVAIALRNFFGPAAVVELSEWPPGMTTRKPTMNHHDAGSQARRGT
jgi:hypothetical protein